MGKAYDANQARAPKGSETGGQWIDDDSKLERIFHAKLEKGYEKISDDEYDALDEYTTDGYRYINDSLRHGGEDKNDVKTVKALDGLMRPLPADAVVYRAFRWGKAAKKLDRLKIGGTFSDKAFVSTSLNRGTAENFGYGDFDDDSDDETPGFKRKYVLMRIRVPKGTPSIYVPATEAGRSDIEQELLLPRKTKFRLKSKKGNTFEMEVVR